MNYEETIKFLYAQLPAFQHQGKSAIKSGLKNITLLCEALGNPQKKIKTIHVGGTNGKGSSSHMIASILQEAGYKTGLYTSPHLKDFSERFRINGESVSQEYVVAFVENYQSLIDKIKPSFFELTVALAFKYFLDEKVDIAVIEVGLGGRLDSTNIILPLVSLITNIGLDHQEILGNTLPEIAAEKAGIIKPKTPVVISEYIEETAEVFISKSKNLQSKIYFASSIVSVLSVLENPSITKYLVRNENNQEEHEFSLDLKGTYQAKNLLGVLKVIDILRDEYKFPIEDRHLTNGLSHILKNTNLKGRWQVLKTNPLVICDTGHNEHAFKYTVNNISNIESNTKRYILGFAKDKNIAYLLQNLDKTGYFSFCEFSSHRSMSVDDYNKLAKDFNIRNVNYYTNVNEALSKELELSQEKDFIFIGGSTYLVAEIENL